MKKRILIVDDEFSLRSLMEVVFKDEGYSVSLAEDGISALRTLENGHFDILITDINMPSMNGIELFNNVKVLYPQLPVVFISGSVYNSLSEQLLSEGAFHVFKKPFDLKLLKHVIKHALKSKQPQSKIDQCKVNTCRQ